MTAQHFLCTQCNRKYPAHQKLFDTFYDFQKMAPEPCANCGEALELHVSLDFQLGAGGGDFKVVSAHLPDKLESWLGAEDEEVTFYPFLVVLQRAGDEKQFCWMPYWHVTGKEARYGQHAVCLDRTQFKDLIGQVQEERLQEKHVQERELEPV